MDHTLKNYSGINNLISDNLEPSEAQRIVDFHAADNCRLYVTTIKVMNFQDVIPSTPIDIFQDFYVLVFDLTSMHDATENFHYREPLRLELNFTFRPEHLTEPFVLGDQLSSVAFDKYVVVGKKYQNG